MRINTAEKGSAKEVGKQDAHPSGHYQVASSCLRPHGYLGSFGVAKEKSGLGSVRIDIPKRGEWTVALLRVTLSKGLNHGKRMLSMAELETSLLIHHSAVLI